MSQDQLKKEALAFLPEDRPNFGKLNEVMVSGWGTPLQMVLAGGILFLFTLACLAGIFLWKADPKDTSRGMINIIFAIVAALTGIFGLVAVIRGFMTWGKQFSRGNHWLFFDKGLVVISGGEAKSYRWEKLDIWLSYVTINQRKHKVTVGKKALPLPVRHDFIATINEYQLQRCLPDMVEETRANELVSFGPLQVGCEFMVYRSS